MSAAGVCLDTNGSAESTRPLVANPTKGFRIRWRSVEPIDLPINDIHSG